jgi:catechol 2,3-dioxygenase-like lactoylglutathione lyase family enzyme
MEQVRGLNHVALRCLDLGRCEAFYREVLGLQVARRWPAEGGEDRSVWLSTGQGFLALERASRPVEEEPFEDGPAGWQVVALTIALADRKAWEGRLLAAGVRLARRTPFSLFFRDAEGNRVALTHWPEEG